MRSLQVVGNYKDEQGNIVIAPSGLLNVVVNFSGSNNYLEIAEGCLISNYTINFHSSESQVVIGDSLKIGRSIHGHVIDMGYKSKVLIGANVTAPFGVYISCAEQTSITIGNDSTFAVGTIVRSDDAHMIFDVLTGYRANPSRDVQIGSHVWVGERAGILSGAVIGSGCMVGFQSVVKKKFPNNCLIVGSPARIAKKNIAWDRAHTMHSSSGGLHYTQYPDVRYHHENWQRTVED